jgi:hypothetical protein
MSLQKNGKDTSYTPVSEDYLQSLTLTPNRVMPVLQLLNRNLYKMLLTNVVCVLQSGVWGYL